MSKESVVPTEQRLGMSSNAGNWDAITNLNSLKESDNDFSNKNSCPDPYFQISS